MKKYFVYIYLTDSLVVILTKLQSQGFVSDNAVVDLLVCAEHYGYAKFVGPVQAVCLTPSMLGINQNIAYKSFNNIVIEKGFEQLPLQAALLLREKLPRDCKLICGMQDIQDRDNFGMTLIYDLSEQGPGIYTEYSGLWDENVILDPTMGVLYKLSDQQLLQLEAGKTLF